MADGCHPEPGDAGRAGPLMTGRLGAMAVLAAILLSGCMFVPWPGRTQTRSVSLNTPSEAADLSPTPIPEPIPAPAPTSEPAITACLARASELNLTQQVGQLYMMAVPAGTPVETAVAQLQTSQAGAVILMGNWGQSSDWLAGYTRALQQQAPAGVGLLVGVDQEGGQVQRLIGPGFSTIPPATEQTLLAPAELQAAWLQWGGELRRAGVQFDLAPVADAVPAGQVADNAPIGQLQRGYGSDPAVVAGQVSQVIHGLDAAGVASSVKHFPGLGQVNLNTDFAVAHDPVSMLTPAELQPFQAAIDAGAGSVMVSSAIYDNVDAVNPAVFSPAIVTGILRDRMGFDGVVLSDDLGVAAAVAGYAVAERGTLFLQAGGDMVVVADPAAAQQMVAGTLAAAQSDPQFAASLTSKVARLLVLKQRYGLYRCG